MLEAELVSFRPLENSTSQLAPATENPRVLAQRAREISVNLPNTDSVSTARLSLLLGVDQEQLEQLLYMGYLPKTLSSFRDFKERVLPDIVYFQVPWILNNAYELSASANNVAHLKPTQPVRIRDIITQTLTKKQLSEATYLSSKQIKEIYGLSTDQLRNLRQATGVRAFRGKGKKGNLYYQQDDIPKLLQEQERRKAPKVKETKEKKGHRPRSYKHMDAQELSVRLNNYGHILKERASLILRLRSGLEDGKFWTLQEVAGRFHLGSKAAVTQVEKRA